MIVGAIPILILAIFLVNVLKGVGAIAMLESALTLQLPHREAELPKALRSQAGAWERENSSSGGRGKSAADAGD